MTVDELNWLDGRLRRLQGPDRPWTILFRAQLTDPISRAAVEDAWRAVVTARPELHVSPAIDGWRAWRTTDADPVVHVGDLGPELERARHGRDDRAISVVVDHDPATTISLVVDHALTDGLGGRAILEDLLRALVGAEVNPRPRVDDDALDTLRTRRLGLRAAIGQIPPRRVATLGATGPTTRLASRTVDLAPIDDMRRAGRSTHGGSTPVSVGTVIAGATLDVLRAQSHASGSGRGTVAIGVPVDLRRHVGAPTGTGNAIVNLTIRDRVGGSDSTAADLGAISAAITERTTHRRLAETLSWMKRATRPGPPSTTTRAGRHVATAMVSNLGLLGTDPCWALVDRVEFAPPAHQTISIGITGLHGRLAITVRSRLQDPSVTDELASAIAARLGSGTP